MGVRRVQKVGKSTFTVSLPHEWVKKNKIAPKTEVNIATLPNGSLMISTGECEREERRSKDIVIEARDPDAGDLIRKTLAAYIANYDIIKLDLSKIGFEPYAKDRIRKMIKFKMAGAEIIEETSDGIMVQILLRPYEFPLDKLLLRMSTMARDMISDIIKAERISDVNSRNDMLSDIIERDDDVDKLYFMGSRWLSSMMENQSSVRDFGLTDVKTALDYRLAFRNIERVSDHAVRIASQLIGMTEVEESILGEILQLLSEAGEIFMRAVNCFKNGSMQEAGNVIHDARRCAAMEEELTKRLIDRGLPAKTIASAMIVMDSIRRIAEYGIGISELAFNVYIRKESTKAA
ncbi:MAG: phosphate uptake regulator PhoU [Candidatus Methanosuratus sp.]|nr:phosphate uptake regulator PhoU [Candidatus Methanosuratincola sp.]